MISLSFPFISSLLPSRKFILPWIAPFFCLFLLLPSALRSIRRIRVISLVPFLSSPSCSTFLDVHIIRNSSYSSFLFPFAASFSCVRLPCTWIISSCSSLFHLYLVLTFSIFPLLWIPHFSLLFFLLSLSLCLISGQWVVPFVSFLFFCWFLFSLIFIVNYVLL